MVDKTKKRKTTILVIEDDEDVISSLSQVYSEIHFDVLVARTAKEAMPIIFKAPPDIVILSINLPDLDGFRMSRELKNNMMLRHVPIIMLSSRPDFLNNVKGMDVVVDEYMTKPFNNQELLIRTKMVLERSKSNLDANPLTRLPGNQAIVKSIKACISAKKPFAVGYADLNNFKAYNDKYGFNKGDHVISYTAKVITSCIQRMSPKSGFVGHVGGDDFIFICDYEKGSEVCKQITEEFDKGIPSFYSKEDLKNGYVVVEDRRGIVSQVPLISVAIGMASDEGDKFANIGEINNSLSQLKKYAKSFSGSAYVRDRRSLNGAPEEVGEKKPEPSPSKLIQDITQALGSYMPNQLNDVLEQRKLSVVFHTIIDMVEDEVIGHEGLIRGPEGTPFESPDKLFQIARTTGQVVKLDQMCMDRIFAAAAAFTRGLQLFVNVFPETLLDKDALARLLSDKGVGDRKKLVVELSGAHRASDANNLYTSLKTIKEHNIKICIDSSVMLGEDGRHFLPDLNPDYIKMNMRHFQDISTDVDLRVDFEKSVHLLKQVCTELICTKLESRDDANMAAQLGIRLGQGFLFARPTAPATSFQVK